MNNTITLTITSLLMIIFSSFHLADDVVRGIEPGGTSNYTGVMILAVFLYATVMLAGRRMGARDRPARIARRRGGPLSPHDGVGIDGSENRQRRRGVFLGLDALRAWRDGERVRGPRGARAMAAAMG
jgi:hypothetical protein